MDDLGRLYCGLSRYDEAESLFDKALSTARRVLGYTHFLTTYSLYGLGTM